MRSNYAGKFSKEVLVLMRRQMHLATTQRCWCFPLIRWTVHPEDARAFSCGVTTVCACLSCGRRWLRVGVEGVVRWLLLEDPCVSWKWEGVGLEEIKKGAKEWRRGAFTQQTDIPSPSSYPCTRPPTVGDIDPGGAVNGSGMESVCCVCSQRG